MDVDNPNVSICICGDGGCGKSSITLRLVRSQWTTEYDPTIEDSYSVSRTIDGKTYNLALTDTAGQEEYRGLWAASNLRADAFLLVYDITNVNSLDALEHYTSLLEMETETRLDNRKIPPIMIVAGNKCDLKDSRAVKSAQGWEWARQKGCGFMETSARDMVNIEETFALLVRRVVAARLLAAQGLPPQTLPHSVAQTQPLTPMSEKELRTNRNFDFDKNPSKQKQLKKSFWSRLKCW